MAQQKQLKEEILSNNNYKLLTRAYQEHAVGQMNFAKYSVLTSREFDGDLKEIFSNVKTSYKNIIIGKNIKNVVKKNGKQAWILVSANKKLYGDILIRICRLFVEKVKNIDPKKVDLIIIGRQGKNFFDAQAIHMPYKYYEFPEFNVSLDFLKEVNENLIYYEDVLVFYGKFNNLVSQTAIQTSIAGGTDSSKQDDAKSVSELQETKKHSFLFEPSVQEILAFFENQILSLLLNQIVQESQLARFASRIAAMEQAQQNIEKQLLILIHRERVVKNMDMNKRQLETLAGRTLWAR